jgi:hypothetical protein
LTPASLYVLHLFVFDTPAPDAVPSPQTSGSEDAARRKGRVEGLVQRVIDLAHEDDFERHDAVSESLRWRLDDSFLDRDFADKPIDQVIRAICKGLGVPAPGPIDEETTLWAINLRKQPLPVTEPVPPEAAPPEEDWGPLEGHVPIQSSA